ncbi:MAG: ComEC/Rec2 family competence protein [Phycisphaerales bacterium]
MAHASPTPAAWRALTAIAAIALGYSLARHLTIPSAAAFGVASGLCALAALSRHWLCRVALFAALAAAASGWFTLRLLERPADNALAALEASPLPVTIVGIVRGTPERILPALDPLAPFAATAAPWRFELDALHLEPSGQRARGIVRVYVTGRPPPIAPGTVLAVQGLFSPSPPPMNPGEIDRRLFDRQAGIFGSLRAPSPELVRPAPLPLSTLQALRAAWLDLRQSSRLRAQRLLLGDAPNSDNANSNADSSPARALLANLVLGLSSPDLDDARAPFTRIGLAHVLAISGFHLSIMTAIGLFLLRLPRDLGRIEPILIIALILLYMLVLPFNAPVWRSALAVIAVLLADASGRRYDPLAILAWIAAALLVARPLDLWSLGFQLSFGLVALMLRYGNSFDARLFGLRIRGLRRSLPEPASAFLLAARRLLSTNLLCLLAATPLIAHHTGLVSPAALVSGFLLIPPMIVLLAGAYLAILLGVLLPPLAEPVISLLHTLANASAAVANLIDTVPGSSLRAPALSTFWTIATTAVVLLFIARPFRRDPAARLAALGVILWTLAEVILGPRLPRSTPLRIDTLAVGDGTCHLLRSGTDAILWDCGSLSPSMGRGMIPRALRNLGAWRVPTAVITHPNLDHFNALLDAAQPLGLRTVLVSPAFLRAAAERPHAAEAFLLDRLARRHIAVHRITRGHSIPLGHASIDFLSPPADATWPEPNDHSLVAIVRAPGVPAILLTGDVQDRAIEALRAAGTLPPIAVMEAPHHGSAKPAAVDWLRAVDPPIVMQSTGPSRARDDRWQDTRASRLWFCTAERGSAWAEVRADGSLRAGAFRSEREVTAKVVSAPASPPGTAPSASPATPP